MMIMHGLGDEYKKNFDDASPLPGMLAEYIKVDHVRWKRALESKRNATVSYPVLNG